MEYIISDDFLTTCKDGKIRQNRKEHHFTNSYKVVSVIDGKLIEIVDLRIYCTTSRVYACVWVHDKQSGTYRSGGGHAGGYGYDKESAAVWEALNDMGIDFRGLNGVGSGAIEEGLLTLASDILGYEYGDLFIVKAYG
jgi:hypothetical protein